MSPSVHSASTFDVVAGAGTKPVARQLLLRPSDDGWSLLTPDGEVVYRGLGEAGRRQCLKFACARGVLAVIS
jgi:hypothetical protein